MDGGSKIKGGEVYGAGKFELANAKRERLLKVGRKFNAISGGTALEGMNVLADGAG